MVSRQLAIVWIAASTIVTVGCGTSVPPREERAVFCLTTEFLPEPPPTERNLMRYPLVRELGRQAVLIAARDGLGLPTRDETLGEEFVSADVAQPGPFDVAVRAYNEGVCHLRLSPSSAAKGTATVEAAKLEREYRFQADTYNMYTALAQSLAAASRADLVESLTAAGFEGEAVAVNDNAPLPEGVSALLEQMNFVSQYAAVRAIHDAIIKSGESPARLGGLVRGYANLAMLTRHHWSSAESAFAARALLYAERMIAISHQDPAAYRHRAYARAIVGLHGIALQDIAGRAAGDDDAATDALTSWFAVVEPFCRFDEKKLATLEKSPGLSELAPQLAFELTTYYTLPRRTGEAGMEAMTKCPEAYNIHGQVADRSVMAFQRWAERTAASNFGGRLPRRVATLQGLPQPVQEMLQEFRKPENSVLVQLGEGRTIGAPYSELPSQIADALRGEVAKSGDLGEPSWIVLAQLVSDEQFIQLANTLEVAQNAVEFSKKEMVDGFMPLVKGHPYAPYIQSFAFNKYEQPEERKQQLSQLALNDPRMRMNWVLNSYPDLKDAYGFAFSEHYTTAAWQRDYTLPALVEALQDYTNQWLKKPGMVEHFQRLSDDVEAISPHSPHVLRFRIDTTFEPTAEQLADWEERAVKDSTATYKVGAFHDMRGDFAAAIRCYERSYELCPDASTTTVLATAYRKNGQEEKWLPTLERYLAEKDYALGHSMIRLHIAKDLCDKGKWSEAEPYAIAGAEVWSADGLMSASRVCEGLGKWDESERWVREAVTNYPSYQGMEWYFWCRRTGRGDLQQAKRYADNYYKLPGIQSDQRGAENEFVYAMLDGRTADALSIVQEKESLASQSYYWLHAAQLAKRLGNDAEYQAHMAKVWEEAKGYEKTDPLYYGLVKILYDHRDEPLPVEALADADKSLVKVVAWSRCNFEYFIGEFLALEGDVDGAEVYWRRAVASGPFEKWNATFAGDRLVKKHGTSRPDDASTAEAAAVSEPATDARNDES